MADSNLTIGATFDKGQLDAAIAEGTSAVQQLPDKFNLAFREMSTSSQRALRQISADTKAAATNMSAQWQTVAGAAADYAASQRELRAALKLTTDQALDQSDTLGILAAAKQRAAAAAQTLSAAEAEAATSIEGEAAAADTATVADQRMQYSMAYGTARIAAYEGGVGSLGYALGGVLGRMKNIAPIMAGLFKVAAASAFAAILVQIGESVKKWYDNTVLLKQEIADLNALVAQTGAGMNQANWGWVQAKAGRMRAEGDPVGAQRFIQQYFDAQPIKLSLKIKQADLDKVTSILDESGLPNGARDLVNQAQRPDLTMGQAQALLPKIGDELDRIERIKNEKNLYGDLTHNPQQIAVINDVAAALQNVYAQIYKIQATAKLKSGTSLLQAETQEAASIKTTKLEDPDKAWMDMFAQQLQDEKANHVMSLQEEVAFWQQRLALVASGSAAAVAITKNMHALQSQIAKKAQQEDLAGQRARTAADAAAEKMREQQGAAAAKAILDDITKQMQAESDAYALKMQGDEQAALRAVQLEQQKNDQEYALGKIGAGRKLALDLQTEEKQFQIEQQYLLKKVAMLRTEDPDYPVNKQKLLNQLSALKDRYRAKDLSLEQRAALDHERLVKSTFQIVNQTLDQSLRGVLQGTETISYAFRNMGANMVASFADSMAKVGLNFLETHLLMRQISAETALKGITNDAAGAFSSAFKATAGIPIIGPALAPIAGATAFAAVAAEGAFVSAAGGQWRVPNIEQLTMLHRDESVIPAQYAESLRRTVEGGGPGGGEIHLHIHAVDAQSVQRLFAANGRALAQVLRDQVRKGAVQ